MTMITITRMGTVAAADDDTMATSEGVGSTPRAIAVDAPVVHVETLKAMLADALSMLECAEIIDFNGHMSARLPDTDRVLVSPLVSSSVMVMS